MLERCEKKILLGWRLLELLNRALVSYTTVITPFGSQLQLQPNSIFLSHHSSHQLQPANSIFLSHHSIHQLQPSERRVNVCSTNLGSAWSRNILVPGSLPAGAGVSTRGHVTLRDKQNIEAG